MLASKFDGINLFVGTRKVINHFIHPQPPLSGIQRSQGWCILDGGMQSGPELPQKLVRGSGTRRHLL